MTQLLRAVFLLAVFWGGWGPTARAQSVSCPIIDFSAGSTLTLPCGPPPGCTALTATLPDIRNTTAYTIDSIPYSGHFPFTIAGATGVSVGTDDVYSPAITLPFPFCYYGTSYTTCYVGSNGIISFNAPSPFTSICDWEIEDFFTGVIYTLPNATEHDLNAIFAVFHDIDPSIPSLPGAGVDYALAGTAPCRKLIVNFRDIAHYSSAGECDTLRSTFQIVLFENTNVIEVYIKDKPVCPTWNDGRAILGLHNTTGSAATVIPGKNATVWGDTAFNKAYRFIPNGTSLLSSVTLLSSTGTVLGTGTTVVSAPGELTATFPSVCVADSGVFIAKADYIPCSGTALSATDTIKVKLPAGPGAPTVSSPVNVCQGAPAVTLSATGTGLLWYTTSAGGTGSATAPVVSTATAGSFTYYVSQTAGGCEGPRAAIIVNVGAAGAFSATAAICPGGTISFGGTVISAPGVYTDTLLGASGCDSVVTLTVISAPFTTGGISATICAGDSFFFNGAYRYLAGSYGDTLLASSGCDSVLTLTLSVTPLPAPPVVVSPVTYCAGDVAAPLSATGSNLLWYTSATGGTGSATAPTPGTATSGTTTYYVSQTPALCESPRAAIAVIVNPIPTVSISPAAPSTCLGSPVTLTASGATSYVWTGSALSSTTGNPVTATPTGIAVYTVTGTAAGCSSTASVTVTIVPPPTVTVSSSSPVCAGATLALLAGGAASYSWTGPAGFSSTLQNPVIPAVTAAQAGVYTVTGYAGVGSACSSAVSTTVVVNPAPPPPVVASPVTYCIGFPTFPLTAAGTNLLWYSTGTGGTGSTTAPTPSSTAAGISNYYVSQTVGGCESPRALGSVVVVASLDPPLVSSPVQYCGGTTAAPLTATGTNLLWYTDPLIPSTGSPVAPTPSTTTPGVTLYYVTQSSNGCVSLPATIQVIVNPEVDVAIGIDQNPICANVPGTVTATGSVPPGATYTWNWGGAMPLSGSGAGPYTVGWPGPGVYTIRVAAGADGCEDTASLTVTVKPAPQMLFAAPERACIGDEIRVAGIDATPGIDEDSLRWNFDGAAVLNGYGGGPYLLRYDDPGEKVITLVAITGDCPSDAATDTITVYPPPSARILPPDDARLCVGDTVRFRAVDTAAGYRYAWAPVEAFLTNDTFEAIGYVQPNRYTLRITDSIGCIGEDTLTIAGEGCCQVLLPTAFSPNGDTKNDFFRPITGGQHTSFDLRVYNRWGAVVFQTGDQYTWWDGTYQGKPQDLGVYFWRLKYRCGNGNYEERQGEVTLVR